MDNLEVFAFGIMGSRGDSAIAFLGFYSSMEVNKASAVSYLSRSQSYACLTSPLIEMTPLGPDIFKTR
jgi:hypothetical protein